MTGDTNDRPQQALNETATPTLAEITKQANDIRRDAESRRNKLRRALRGATASFRANRKGLEQ